MAWLEKKDEDLVNQVTYIQGDAYKVLWVRGGMVMLVLLTDAIRGIGPLYVSSAEKVREGLCDGGGGEEV